MFRKMILGIVLISMAVVGHAQKGWEAGGWVGASHYFGDLNSELFLGRPGLTGGLNARYNFNKRVCLKMAGNYGRISGYDSDADNLFQQARNLSFRSDILEGLAQFEFNFFTYTHGSKDQFFSPYLFAGLNVFNFNPQAELDGEWIDLRPLGTEGQFKGEEYYITQVGLVYGTGMKFSLSYRWSINIELSARRLFTDYLDDVSTTYPDLEDLERARGEVSAALSDRSLLLPGINETGELSQPGRQRGNSVTQDSYASIGISVMYYFGDIQCPTVTQ
jgi:hypothetical protein